MKSCGQSGGGTSSCGGGMGERPSLVDGLRLMFRNAEAQGYKISHVDLRQSDIEDIAMECVGQWPKDGEVSKLWGIPLNVTDGPRRMVVLRG